MTENSSGPTGEICFDLPSPYEPHPCGLLHLPRFIAKCRKHLAGELPQSYRKNFCRGFDRFLSMHLGLDPNDVLQAVKAAGGNSHRLDTLLDELFPENLRVAEWNREICHKGQTEAGREFLAESLTKMGTHEMIGKILSVMDMIDFDEGRIPGFSDQQRKAWEENLKSV
jgi:transcriptional regulator of acetoin/glycerol metabolism